MPTDCIPFRTTGYFSDLICDYLDQNSLLKPFYNRFPTLDNFKGQIEDKKVSFSDENRKILAEVLDKQYQNVSISKTAQNHINSLSKDNTFTVTTGHQLNLFTGPLYFLYKIVSTINLCKQLKKTYPDYNFVPIYWMASEDHDFEEISFFNFNNKKIVWNRESGGAVGEMNTEGLEDVFAIFSKELSTGQNADTIRQWFKTAYLEHDNLTDATRYLANQLFGEHGLVILDANDKTLKQLFVPQMKRELLEQESFKNVSATNEKFDYKIQVNPREINLFYMKQGLRERIEHSPHLGGTEGGLFSVVDTDISWTKDELINELETHPERFSPNVIMRPLYQEVILPNLCYIGGGGELAYWLQLKSNFEAFKVPFPVLLLRNSVLLMSEKQAKKLKKLDVSIADVFLKRDSFINKKVRQISNIDIDFSPQKKHLEEQFEQLYQLAELTDKSFLSAVKAQEIKQKKGLKNLEKRLLKAQKRKLADHVTRITNLQNELFPNYSLQERNANFSQFYQVYGKALIEQLIQNLKPLKSEFLVLTLE